MNLQDRLKCGSYRVFRCGIRDTFNQEGYENSSKQIKKA